MKSAILEQIPKPEEMVAVGKSFPRIEGYQKVTGRTKFCFDMELPRMIYGKIKRSPFPHARILSIDTSKAEAFPGVRAVMTARDVPPGLFGYGLSDEAFIARDRVRYVGEPVAAVAADTEEIAEEALELIEVKYEELPAVFDPEEAMKRNPSAVIHPDLPKYQRNLIYSRETYELPNVPGHFKIRHGDVEQGFAKADHIFENRFKIHMIQHVPMELHSCIANVEPGGDVTLWTGSQQPYLLLTQMVAVLGVRPSQVRIIVPYVGGGFGNKTQMKAEPFAVVLSKKAQRPVKIVLTREEVFSCTTVRQPFIVDVKDGVNDDGQIIARQVRMILNTGAYTEDTYIVNRNAAYGAVSTYKIPNFKLDSYCVYTNQPVGGAFRGFGSAEVQTAIESHMDIVAEKLGLDPVEFRMKHLLEEGDRSVIGEVMHSVGAKECLRKVVEVLKPHIKPEIESGPWRRGKGLAVGNKYSLAPSASAAFVKVHPDETIEVRTSSIDIGQGVYTTMAQIAAEVFKAPLEMVKVYGCDTSFTPYDHGAISSRSTYEMGNAVRLAALDARRQILDLASKKLKINPDQLDSREAKIFPKSNPMKGLRIRDLFSTLDQCGLFLEEGGEIIGRATWFQKASQHDYETGQVTGGSPCAYYAYSAQGAEVEVNIETGKVRVLKYVNACDVGRAINPRSIEGQIEGGTAMGIGGTLMEELILEEGRVLNGDFLNYKILTSLESVPRDSMTSIIVEAGHRDGPFGAKGVGEVALIASGGAIANAIYNACGVRIHNFPAAPDKILAKLKKSGQQR